MAIRTLSDTIARLNRMSAMPGDASADAGRLAPLTYFGSNPGQLKAWTHVPESLRHGAPLVVVLHGCTQNAAGYDRGSGWSQLAEQYGFALLYPEQQRSNNPNLCFNWFANGDITRDGGEALSIRQMVARVVADHAIDAGRVFVTGLSAGGAMTAVMLATYPEVFAGGGVIAGLPYGCATSVSQALDRMRGHKGEPGAALAQRVTGASAHRGPWPSLSVWHGTADQTVAVSNMDALIEQWRALHDLPSAPSSTDTIDGQARRRWADAEGRVRIEAVSVAGMGHGTPIAAGGPDGCGTAMPYMIEAGISSTRHLAALWKIAGEPVVKPVPVTRVTTARVAPKAALPSARKAIAASTPVLTGVAKVIDDALRAGGLIR